MTRIKEARAHHHLGLGQAAGQVVEVQGAVEGEEANLGALAARQAVQAVLDGLADHGQRARVGRHVGHIDDEEESGRHRRPHLQASSCLVCIFLCEVLRQAPCRCLHDTLPGFSETMSGEEGSHVVILRACSGVSQGSDCGTHVDQALQTRPHAGTR